MVSLECVIENVPPWVKRQVNPAESKALANEIRRSKARSAIEIGVAAGYSSAVMYAALAQNTNEPKLYAFDFSERCYHDKSKRTGDAFYEIHGPQEGYVLKTGIESSSIETCENVDFIFVDANHQNPWPALDLISLARFVNDGTIIALHDFEMIYHSWGRHASGARDLYRAWRGDKYRYADSSNLAFLVFDRATMWASLPTVFETDWDTAVNHEYLKRFRAIVRETAPFFAGRRVRKAMRNGRGTEKNFKPIVSLENVKS